MGAWREPVPMPVRPWRRTLVLLVLGAGALTVLGRTMQLQLLERDFLAREGERRAVRTLTVEAHRGAITDRNGEPLALSAPVDAIWAVPSALAPATQYHAPLARLLDMPVDSLRARLAERPDAQFLYLRRNLSPDEADRVLALGAPGVFRESGYRRFYPAGEVAAHVVGFVGIDGTGQEGIERAADAMLAGVPGRRTVVRARDGRVVEDGIDARPARPGADLRLTIDLRLQYVAYRELKRAVAEHGARGGVAVIADPRSGEILAAVSQPGYNPNRLEERGSAAVRNRAVTDVFEPGSSIKPLLVAAALEDGRFRADSVIDTGNGLLKVSGHLVRDRHRFGRIDLGRLLAVSSNVGAATIGLALGRERLHEAYARFGFGQPVGSGFPGEVAGTLRPASAWREVDTATAAFGYGVSLTALHLVRAYSAIAADGRLPALRWHFAAPETPAAPVLEPRVARDLRRLLMQVVSPEGTAGLAAVPGYEVAGKTGTVRKLGPGGYDGGSHQAIFCGMLPASRPRLVIVAMLDEPSGPAYAGGQVAAPLFARIAASAARILAIEPSTPMVLAQAGGGAR